MLGFGLGTFGLSTFTLLHQHITLAARHPALHTDDADVFFTLFERMAEMRDWSNNNCCFATMCFNWKSTSSFLFNVG